MRIHLPSHTVALRGNLITRRPAEGAHRTKYDGGGDNIASHLLEDAQLLTRKPRVIEFLRRVV